MVIGCNYSMESAATDKKQMPGHIVTGLQPGRASRLPSELGTSAAVQASAEFQFLCP